jgi:hypothetical protein
MKFCVKRVDDFSRAVTQGQNKSQEDYEAPTGSQLVLPHEDSSHFAHF